MGLLFQKLLSLLGRDTTRTDTTTAPLYSYTVTLEGGEVKNFTACGHEPDDGLVRFRVYDDCKNGYHKSVIPVPSTKEEIGAARIEGIDRSKECDLVFSVKHDLSKLSDNIIEKRVERKD